MEAWIEKGRIKIRFQCDGDDLLREQGRIMSVIGSAHPVDGKPEEMSCALSAHNFRKLRGLGCKLADDTRTREIVNQMRRDLDEYEATSRKGGLAKRGEVDSPYAFKKPPFKHQVKGFHFLHALDNPGLFGDVGSGKTFIVSTFADSLIKNKEKITFLVICPVNLIKHVWLEDIAKFTDLTAVGLREDKVASVLAEDYDEKGDPEDRSQRARLREIRRSDPESKKRAKLRAAKRHAKVIQERFDQVADVYVINPESLRTDPKEKRVRALCQRLRNEGKRVYLVIDESSRIKSRASRTFKAMKRIRSLCSNCCIMTGTPSPNGLLDLWAQFSICDGGKTLQPNFVDYRFDTCQETILRNVTWKDKAGQSHNATKWAPKPGAAMQVHRILEPRVIRFRTDECIDLPPKRFLVREVEMNKEQTEVYEAMENMLFAELEGESVTSTVAATKMIKLREITGGFVRTDLGNDKQLGADSPKMIVLDELLEQSIADKLGDVGPPSKALIWAQYQWECKALVKRYQRQYGAMGMFGGISLGQKDQALRRFKSDHSCRVLVCHPASVGHGLTLTEADYAFYYSLSHNFEEFYQSQGRMARPGQKRTMTYYFLVCPGTIDEELINAIRAKKNLSDLVTDGRFARQDILGARGDIPSQLSISWHASGDPDGSPGQPDQGKDHAVPDERVGGNPADRL
jgi:SNF2 family DNA or RNA helicase